MRTVANARTSKLSAALYGYSPAAHYILLCRGCWALRTRGQPEEDRSSPPASTTGSIPELRVRQRRRRSISSATWSEYLMPRSTTDWLSADCTNKPGTASNWRKAQNLLCKEQSFWPPPCTAPSRGSPIVTALRNSLLPFQLVTVLEGNKNFSHFSWPLPLVSFHQLKRISFHQGPKEYHRYYTFFASMVQAHTLKND